MCSSDLFCHSYACGGHFGAKRTVRKVLECGFYWLSIFHDSYSFCKSCEHRQKIGNISQRNEMPQTLYYFAKFLMFGELISWDCSLSFGYVYILLVVDYVSKWVKAKVTRIDDSKVVRDFYQV